ncbi:regulator of G-protein signaling 20 isoform X4 [Callithrix jacchus]|uniref:regulator of G-protein signaling 20 isoform X4 n=1 Tax=Callithrix jacchus TaxID=9483 RepID=UPI00159DD802|nr:regulator of G-protein signaling 20 isoform X4 [Callithrix jacchus]
MRTADGGEPAGASPPAGGVDGGLSPLCLECLRREMKVTSQQLKRTGTNAFLGWVQTFHEILSLTVRNQEDQRPTIASHELRADLPTWEESPAPTLEEVNAWAQSFDKLMVTPAGRNAFREFLRTEFSEENMLFWMACEELKKEANKNIIEEKARIIYEDYISILSPKEVSLDSRVREVINRNMVEPSQHIFDDAQLQIYTLMHRDSYPRFMNSTVYKDLLQSLSEKSIEA